MHRVYYWGTSSLNLPCRASQHVSNVQQCSQDYQNQMNVVMLQARSLRQPCCAEYTLTNLKEAKPKRVLCTYLTSSWCGM